MRSDGLGPFPEAQVGQEGVFLGGGAQRGARWRREGGGGGGGVGGGGEEEGDRPGVECEAAAVLGEQGGEGDQVGAVAVPVLLEHQLGGGGEEEGGGGGGGAGAGGGRGSAGGGGAAVAGVESGLRLLLGGLAQREGQGHRLQSLGGSQAGQGAAAPAASAAAPSPPAAPEEKHLVAVPLGRRPSAERPRLPAAPRRPLLLLFILSSSSSPSSLAGLVLLEVAAEHEGVRGGEGTLAAAEGLARRVLQLLVQVEVVLALAAVRAAVAVEGPLARVHAHVLDELVGRLGEVAAALAPVVVAQAVGADVGVQRGLVGPQCLADAAAVLHLAVGLQVALHGCRATGGVDAERAPAGGGWGGG